MQINVLEIIEKIREEKIEKFKDVTRIGGLAIVQVGDNQASNLYVKSKIKEASKWKVEPYLFKLPETIELNELINFINILNSMDTINGIIVQLPLPNHLKEYEQNIIDIIAPIKNVDGFYQTHTSPMFVPCTPLGIMKIIENETILKDKVVTLIGRGKTVGEPLINILSKEPCTLMLANSHTSRKQLEMMLESSDIIISAVGKANLFSKFDLNYNNDDQTTYVIDAGISYVDGKQTGDFDHYFNETSDNIKYTPHIGGVGKMTVAMLYSNLIDAVEMQNEGTYERV